MHNRRRELSQSFERKIQAILTQLYLAIANELDQKPHELAVFNESWPKIAVLPDDDLKQYYDFMLTAGIKNSITTYCDQHDDIKPEDIEKQISEMLLTLTQFIYQLYKVQLTVTSIIDIATTPFDDLKQIEININQINLEKLETRLNGYETFTYEILKVLNRKGWYSTDVECKQYCPDSELEKLTQSALLHVNTLCEIGNVNKDINAFHQTYQEHQKHEREQYRKNLKTAKSDLAAAHNQLKLGFEAFSTVHQSRRSELNTIKNKLTKSNEIIINTKQYQLADILKDLESDCIELQNKASALCNISKSFLSTVTLGIVHAPWSEVKKVISDAMKLNVEDINKLSSELHKEIEQCNQLSKLSSLALLKQKQLTTLLEVMNKRAIKQDELTSKILTRLSDVSEIIQGHLDITNSKISYSKAFIQRHWGKLTISTLSGSGASTPIAIFVLASWTTGPLFIGLMTMLGFLGGVGTGAAVDYFKPLNNNSLQDENQALLAPKYAFCEPIDYPVDDQDKFSCAFEFSNTFSINLSEDERSRKSIEEQKREVVTPTWGSYFSFSIWGKSEPAQDQPPYNGKDEIPELK